MSDKGLKKREIEKLKAIEIEKIRNAQLEKEKDKEIKQKEIAKLDDDDFFIVQTLIYKYIFVP